MSDGAHTPVLLDEVVEALAIVPGALVIDGTFGAGGYSRAFVARGARVIALDRDPAARRHAGDLEEAGGFQLIQTRFSRMAAEVGDAAAAAVALDLGLSSMQIDEAERGFSLMRDGPLDMRMGGAGRSAAEMVNEADATELALIFKNYGEEPRARRVAAAIARRRLEAPFGRTLDLADVVERALGGRRGARIHPATRVFQALRIAVNDELAELDRGLRAAEQVLQAGGRLAVVSFHSLEDRIVKSFLLTRSGRVPAGSRHAPPRQEGPAPSFRLLYGGAKTPGEDEIAANPRARSAKLRAAARTDSPPWKHAA